MCVYSGILLINSDISGVQAMRDRVHPGFPGRNHEKYRQCASLKHKKYSIKPNLFISSRSKQIARQG